ncbi:UDP-N-acetylmuramoyl-L-alanyl-D-glutamate--2,6-diaminopimelate ligase [Coralloluteibacterium stylophorae]|uniref:UDP-N-acetylmuramoyl-L-alanyl-D-glutamate--2,6-diaminopimelate ligase n=1 Tax=Coralloluteibacterium stylophorae TaxID=1776034 RepID=A0A8J7VUD9_9GAMM|nr:UDP-N-acetylmuramoyl-L-alanyl-D-glutamate--2,6-diaminopimelate ligase [Coralloluteibacterium stylophorae]MBS7457746.1 UDP-N-acetylmuramoyl-L-alanyl-D-glutamate--2,6-diaminopimelate ligase [Coralloluteibacterium stylophorae]
MPLRTLLEGYASAGTLAAVDADVRGLNLDSRALAAGDAFVALAGATTHGLRFAQAALDAGAAAILFEPPAPADGAIDALPNAVAVPALGRHLGAIASRFYDAPSQAMDVVGVTGTNGKTSTVQMLAQALDVPEARAGSIGTLGAGLHGRLQAGERTTPDVIAVHRLLASMRAEGAQAVAMEVSSHALVQGRVDAVAFRVAVFTNLSRDHLDYHGDMQSYGAAKAQLFRWPGLRAAVINLDDSYGRSLYADLPGPVRRIGVSSRGEEQAVLRATDVDTTGEGLAFRLAFGDAAHPVRSPLLGRFNVDNLLAVAGVLLALDWPLARVAAALAQLAPVPGRMQRLAPVPGRPLVVVDYAHTPDALEQSLVSLRAHTAGRLVCVFGCGGERDRGKRPQMAAVAEALADQVVVTDDNPRREDGDAIVAEILAGFARGGDVHVDRDRARAIARAIAHAGEGDAVLVAGKGHETYQDIGGVLHPFDDAAVARGALEAGA